MSKVWNNSMRVYKLFVFFLISIFYVFLELLVKINVNVTFLNLSESLLLIGTRLTDLERKMLSVWINEYVGYLFCFIIE